MEFINCQDLLEPLFIGYCAGNLVCKYVDSENDFLFKKPIHSNRSHLPAFARCLWDHNLANAWKNNVVFPDSEDLPLKDKEYLTNSFIKFRTESKGLNVDSVRSYEGVESLIKN